MKNNSNLKGGKRLFVSVASGFLKGRKIALPSSATTRPTKSIVQGSFFDAVRDELRGKVFIEVFGGSGLMAITAASEGASAACAIELDREAFATLRQNVSNLNVSNLKVYHGDTLVLTPQIVKELSNLNGENGEKAGEITLAPSREQITRSAGFRGGELRAQGAALSRREIILYIDPPFDIREGFADIYERVWNMLSQIEPSALCLVALEHISSYAAPDFKFDLVKVKERKFGRTTLSFYRPKSALE